MGASYRALYEDRATLGMQLVQADASQISGLNDSLQLALGKFVAYNCTNLGGCTRINVWSNLAKTYDGQAMGTTGTSHNQRVLNNTKSTIAHSASVRSIASNGGAIKVSTIHEAGPKGPAFFDGGILTSIA